MIDKDLYDEFTAKIAQALALVDEVNRRAHKEQGFTRTATACNIVVKKIEELDEQFADDFDRAWCRREREQREQR